MKESTIINTFAAHVKQIARLTEITNMNTWSNNVILGLLIKKGLVTEAEFRDAALGEKKEAENASIRSELVEPANPSAGVEDPPDSGTAC